MICRATKFLRNTWLAWVLIPAGLLVVGANAHLLIVAIRSHPGCLEHVKVAGEGNGYRAAASAC
jgi:hypothetical protein